MNRLVFAAALLSAGLGLAGCGFTPLYGAPGVTAQLTAIQVTTPPGRTGQLIREHLDDALARDKGAAPRYRMDLRLSETRYPRGVRVDNVATRYEYVLIAAYTLSALPSGSPVKSGSARVEVTYDSADQPYASISAQQDAQDRAAGEAARKIELELAAWLATQAGKS
ncbi:LPS assembly lipoprotein LptE [Phenylobacterium sp.]|uniref:LPS assembly lipoprotein LptE n=1 Tax=Phenylobacterium sp. TaxID=1871053 RepID=UPI00286AFA24|nr:LPS assembly lipoprotein LptE [Phenylobacterium sp.]